MYCRGNEQVRETGGRKPEQAVCFLENDSEKVLKRSQSAVERD